ncbi:hypothetical protein BH09ACT6_BH09ACT6_26010 [soil metagenome]
MRRGVGFSGVASWRRGVRGRRCGRGSRDARPGCGARVGFGIVGVLRCGCSCSGDCGFWVGCVGFCGHRRCDHPCPFGRYCRISTPGRRDRTGAVHVDLERCEVRQRCRPSSRSGGAPALRHRDLRYRRRRHRPGRHPRLGRGDGLRYHHVRRSHARYRRRRHPGLCLPGRLRLGDLHRWPGGPGSERGPAVGLGRDLRRRHLRDRHRRPEQRWHSGCPAAPGPLQRPEGRPGGRGRRMSCRAGAHRANRRASDRCRRCASAGRRGGGTGRPAAKAHRCRASCRVA